MRDPIILLVHLIATLIAASGKGCASGIHPMRQSSSHHRRRQAHRSADRARHPASAIAPSEVLAVYLDAFADLDEDA